MAGVENQRQQVVHVPEARTAVLKAGGAMHDDQLVGRDDESELPAETQSEKAALWLPVGSFSEPIHHKYP
jgi:hypothetical protein